jgi:hypothetical protein
MRRLASIRSLPLLLALTAASCERTTPVTDATTEPTDGSKRPAGDDRKATPAADPTHPLELVPARARAMIMAKSPQRLAQIWERERFAGSFPAEYAELVGDMKREVGLDLLDPAALTTIGIDVTAPVGAAVLSFDDDAFVFFGGTGNPTALVELFERLMKKPLRPEALGEAKLYAINEDLTLVLRHGMFALVFVEDHRSGQPDYAQEVARIDPAQSLAHATTMERAHLGMPQDADVRGLLDVAGIMRDELEISRRRDQESAGEINRRLAEARQRGASPEEIAGLQQQVQAQQDFVTRRQRERQVAELLLARTIGAIEGIGLAVDADQSRGLLGRIHVALEPDAVFRELLVESAESPTALRALGDEPQLVLSGQVDPGVAMELFAQAALAAGTSYADINDEMLRDLHVDFDRAVRPLLDGRASFVLTAASTIDPKRPDAVEEAMGGILAIGVKDEVKARALLDQAIGKHTEKRPEHRLTPTPEISGWTLTRNEAPRTVHFGVVKEQLVVGTDLATIRRMRDGEVGPAGSRFADPEPWQRLTEGSGVGRLAMHHHLPTSMVFAFRGAFDDFMFSPNPDDQLASEFPEADVFSIPRSAATKRAEKDRQKALNARMELSRKLRNERQAVAWTKASALGITAGVVREIDSGLVIEGGHYVAGGVFGYAETIVELIRGGKTEPPELARSRKRIEELDARVQKARRKDVEKELAKRKKSGAPPPPPVGPRD